jgi:hypothetical protein
MLIACASVQAPIPGCGHLRPIMVIEADLRSTCQTF